MARRRFLRRCEIKANRHRLGPKLNGSTGELLAHHGVRVSEAVQAVGSLYARLTGGSANPMYFLTLPSWPASCIVYPVQEQQALVADREFTCAHCLSPRWWLPPSPLASRKPI